MLDLLNFDSNEAWVTAVSAALAVTMIVGVISIVIEVLWIIFMFTPSKADDRFIAKFKKQWEKVKPFFELLKVRSPITLVMDKIRSRLEAAREALHKIRVKRSEKQEARKGKPE